MTLLVSNITVPLGVPNWVGILLNLIPALVLVLGWMLARESRGRTVIEIIAVLALLVSTTVPAGALSLSMVTQMAGDIRQRYPIALILLGAAWIRDGGAKIALGIIVLGLGFVLSVQSGLISA